MMSLNRALRQVSQLLRDREEWAGPSRRGEVRLDAVSAATLALTSAAAYGLCVGLFGLAHGLASWRIQMLATTVKLPALTVMMFLATCPVFFAANAIGGLRLPPGATLRLSVATFAVFAAVLGLFAPITAAVSVLCNYSFATLINAAMIATAGFAAVAFLLHNVRRLARAKGATPTGARRPLAAFAAWAIVFAMVGAEFGWRIRPLVGWREEPFRWYRTDGMTLWEGIRSEIQNILTDGGA
jgi:hypothetical protein